MLETHRTWAVCAGFCLVVTSVVWGQADAPSLNPQAVRGVNYAHIHRRGHGYGSDTSRRELADLREIGVDWIAVTPFGYQPSSLDDHLAGFDPDQPAEAGAPDRPGRDRSLTDRDLADQVAAAHELGVKVLIKPHIWSRDFWQGDMWHGSIDQQDPKAHERWRRSYRLFMLHYARLARDTDADALCIGTELVQQTLQYPGDWRSLIAEVRTVYPGPITYAAHWDQEYGQISFWDDLDAIGISAYFPLDVPDDAQVQQLVDAWQPHKVKITQIQQRYRKPVVFLELGYRPATGAYREPWLDRGGETDPMIQARGYEAVFRAFADEPWWHGLFIWKTFTDPNRPDRHGSGPGYSFRNRPAEQVIQQWFRSVKDLGGK